MMKKYDIPTSEFQSFGDKKEAIDYLNTRTIPIVIKEDGLRAGKGVTVAFTKTEALEALEQIFSIPNRRIFRGI